MIRVEDTNFEWVREDRGGLVKRHAVLPPVPGSLGGINSNSTEIRLLDRGDSVA